LFPLPLKRRYQEKKGQEQYCIVEAQAKRDAKEATAVKGKRGPKRKSSVPVVAQAKRPRKSEMEVAQAEIEAGRMGNYYSVIQFP
jgi:hypothetical protein